MWQDVCYALRMLRKLPGFTAVAIIILAIGIGANTIMFSVSDALLLLHPKKVKNPEQLAYCAIQNAQYSWFRYSEYLTLRDSGLAFSDIMAQTDRHRRETLVREGAAWHVSVTYVSVNYFSVLGVAPARGRGFLPEEEQDGSAPVVVLSYRCWQRLGGDSKIVGAFLRISGTDCQVVGVAPEGFTGITLQGPDLWLPLGSFRTVSTLLRVVPPDWKPWFDVVGRLKTDLDLSVAQAQLQTLFPQFEPECLEWWGGRPSFSLRPPGRRRIAGESEQERQGDTVISLVLMTASALILVIACLNLGSMLIVQGTSRHGEIAVRLALGAGRWRIIRQLFIEYGLLAVLGGALGVLPALGGMRILNRTLAAAGEDLPLALNVRVLAATLGLCLMATLLFGLRPALWLSKRDLAGAMKGTAGRVLGSLRGKWDGLFVVGQIALAVVLVLSAAILTRSALRIAQPDPRFPLEDKLVVEIDPESGGYNRVQSIQVCDALANHLASLPEVKAVGMLSGTVFFGGGGWAVIGESRSEAGESRSGRPLARDAALVNVGRDYFEAMEIPLLRGRLFNRLDSAPRAEKVAVIDESLARKLRPDGNALGCFLQWGALTKADSEPYRVVGIVAHVPGIEKWEIRAQMYIPTEPNELASCLCLHSVNKGSVKLLQQRILQEIRRVDPRIPVLSVVTLSQKRNGDSWVWLACFAARLALGAGGAALFLATLGIYAVKSHTVAARTSEIGIRMALGATHGSIMSMVLREGLLLMMVGLAIGLTLGLAVAKVAARLLYRVSPADPASIILTVALLGTASLLAGWIPARRATKVDPMVALRSE